MKRYTYDAIPPHTSVSLDTELHGELVMEQRCSNIPDATGGVLRSEIDSRSKAVRRRDNRARGDPSSFAEG